MKMTPELWAAVLNYAVNFGIDAAKAIVKAIGGNATIDDAIAALDQASAKKAQDYINEA